MKKILATAAIVTAMTLPAFAEGDDQSQAQGDAKGSVKATTDMKQNSGAGAMGQVPATRSTTTGSGSTSSTNPSKPEKTSGADGGGSGGSGGGGAGGGDR